MAHPEELEIEGLVRAFANQLSLADNLAGVAIAESTSSELQSLTKARSDDADATHADTHGPDIPQIDFLRRIIRGLEEL